MYPLPVEQVMWVRRNELERDYEEVRLQRAARIANPGPLQRALIAIADLLMRAGQHIREQQFVLPQSHHDRAAKIAA
jgi:hypothetical protein